MRDEIQFQIMMPEASSQSLTVDTPAGGIQWVFYILSFKEEALSLNHLNRAIRFIAISYMYHPDENTNKSHNLNTATRPNVLYESFFSN